MWGWSVRYRQKLIVAATAAVVLALPAAAKQTVQTVQTVQTGQATQAAMQGTALRAPKVTSDIEIDYGDWTGFLRQTVLEAGMPDRASLGRPRPESDTKLILGNRKKTRAEGNRLFYHLITEKGIEALGRMKRSLGDTAADPVFDTLRADERLALWLNLHNIAVVELVAANYPTKDTQSLVEAALDEKTVLIGDALWSIRDIETHVMTKWQDPLVIYGFHRGHIGSPDIQRNAFTGETVWQALERNAREFTSGLRGFQYKREKGKVSAFYASVDQVFPDFEGDLKDHMTRHATAYLVSKILNADTLRPTIEDGTVSDLYQGVTYNHQGSYVQSGLWQADGAFFGDPNEVGLRRGRGLQYPAHVARYLGEMIKKRNRQHLEGQVTIESLQPAESPSNAGKSK